MKFDPKASPGSDPTQRPRLSVIAPRSLSDAAFAGWGPKIG